MSCMPTGWDERGELVAMTPIESDALRDNDRKLYCGGGYKGVALVLQNQCTLSRVRSHIKDGRWSRIWRAL
jgi:hypothetical protein